MKFIGKNQISEREINILYVPSLDNYLLPETLTPYFGVFVACDARQITNNSITELADNLLTKGAVYFSTWGQDCERVNDLFDSAIIEKYPDETQQSVRMTTWHADKSLDEALWFFLNCAFPAEDYEDECHTDLIIVIENEIWSNQIEVRVMAQDGLNKAVVGD